MDRDGWDTIRMDLRGDKSSRAEMMRPELIRRELKGNKMDAIEWDTIRMDLRGDKTEPTRSESNRGESNRGESKRSEAKRIEAKGRDMI